MSGGLRATAEFAHLARCTSNSRGACSFLVLSICSPGLTETFLAPAMACEQTSFGRPSKTVNSEVLLTICGCLIGHYSPGVRGHCLAEDGTAAARNHTGDREATRGTLFQLPICTGIYSWCEPMVHYFTTLSYILCTLLSGKWQILLRIAHGRWKKGTLKGAAPSRRTFMGAARPLPQY